jgi:two-component sensor histidine kinase
MPDLYVDMLMREASHRAKNLLSVVQVMARHTAGEGDPNVFAERFSRRLAGLAASHDLLVAATWRRVDVGDLVRAQLAPFGDLVETRVALDGPPLGLRPAAAQTMGMALHELAANAVRYGSLSSSLGAVRVEWDVDGTGPDACFSMRWSEHGGPAPEPAPRRGFGHTVMVEMVGRALDANVRLAYPSSGVVWELAAPVAWPLEHGRGLSPSSSLRRSASRPSESTANVAGFEAPVDPHPSSRSRSWIRPRLLRSWGEPCSAWDPTRGCSLDEPPVREFWARAARLKVPVATTYRSTDRSSAADSDSAARART